MPGKFFRSLILALTIIAVFIWTSSPELNSYNLQLTGALVLLYFVSKLLFRPTTHPFFLTTLVLISIVLLLIFSTGGVNSPIFFILDFLLFAIALLLAPYQAFLASFLLVSIFFIQNLSNISSTLIVDLLSLILVTPLAVIFSKIYLKNLVSEGKISILQEAIKDEQEDSLLWITTTAKPSLATSLNSLTDIVIYLNSKGQEIKIPKALLDKLKTVQKDLISLYASTGSLEKSIEDSSDKMEL